MLEAVDASRETRSCASTRAFCRLCAAPLRHIFVDLGMSPLCQTHIAADALAVMEPFYPLRAYVCEECLLVQLEEHVSPRAIFSDYAYFASYSESWVAHAKTYVDAMTARLGLGPRSRVVEVASNDGYLLQHFAARGVPAIGVEPAANVAAAAAAKGVRTIVKFFGEATARELVAEGGRADLIVANNVLAHVPDLHDFVRGLAHLLGTAGVLTIEFPHLVRLVEENQFDTIYHEHFSYFSLLTAERALAAHGLRVFDVEELPTHGGSLRVFARHAAGAGSPATRAVAAVRAKEEARGFTRLEGYAGFAAQVEATKRDLLAFLIAAKRAGKSIAGYGAPGKGNTLLNYCGIRTDFLDYTVDRNPHKQGKFTPGTRIPIHAPERIRETKPDCLLVLPWNLRDEVVRQTSYIREWGGRWVLPVPSVEVLS
jgi:SAM-dependent methyltransferase